MGKVKVTIEGDSSSEVDQVHDQIVEALEFEFEHGTKDSSVKATLEIDVPDEEEESEE